MKPYLHFIIAFVLSFPAMLKAQENGQEGYRHWSFGISAGDILHNLFNVENDNRSYPAFVAEYAGHQYALQAGFRPGYNTSDVTHQGFTDTEVTESISLSGNISLTRTVFSDTRWMLRAGLRYDGGWSREDIIEDSGFDRVTTRRLQWNAGGGPVVDFRFFVHPRISVGTDAALIYSFEQSELQQLFTNFPDFNNTKDKVVGEKLRVVEPMTLYLRFHL